MDIFEQVKAEYAKDQRNPRKALTRDDIPLSFDAITRQWVTDVLCDGKPGAQVTSFTLGERDEGTTNRRRIYFAYNEAGERAGLPRSVFCKASHGLSNRLIIAAANAVGELVFYDRVRLLLDIEAPLGYFAKYDPRSFNSFVMMSDLGEDVQFCQHTTQITRQRAKSQMRLLARLHGRFLQRPELDQLPPDVMTFEAYFRHLGNVWRQCCDVGFRAAEEVLPARLFARHGDIWANTIKSVEIHGRLPRTLTHTDVHLRNWYIAPNNEMGLADWQCITKGHGLRDVAYALTTSLTVEDRRAWEEELIAFYVNELNAIVGSTLRFDDAWWQYRQHLFTVLAWWTFTLAPSSGGFEAPDVQPRDATLEFIRRIGTAIDDLDSFSSFVR